MWRLEPAFSGTGDTIDFSTGVVCCCSVGSTNGPTKPLNCSRDKKHNDLLYFNCKAKVTQEDSFTSSGHKKMHETHQVDVGGDHLSAPHPAKVRQPTQSDSKSLNLLCVNRSSVSDRSLSVLQMSRQKSISPKVNASPVPPTRKQPRKSDATPCVCNLMPPKVNQQSSATSDRTFVRR